MWKLVLLIMVLSVLLCSCRKREKHAEYTDPQTIRIGRSDQETVIEPGKALELVSFSFSHNGSMAEDNFVYSAMQSPEGTALYMEQLFSGGEIIDVTTQESILDRLGEAAGRYRLDLWDGYDGWEEEVLDGYGFSLEMELADGRKIIARGNNAFPQSYHEASREICRIFEEIGSKHDPVKPLPLPAPIQESELPIFFAIDFFTGENKDSRFRFGAQRQEDGSVRLIIYIWNFAEFENGEEYVFEGYCDDFPYEKIQNIIWKYDIPSKAGWYGEAESENKEQYTMNFEYDSEGYEFQRMITLAGGSYPEHYEEIRTELLEVMIDFLLENRDSFYQNM